MRFGGSGVMGGRGGREGAAVGDVREEVAG